MIKSGFSFRHSRISSLKVSARPRFLALDTTLAPAFLATLMVSSVEPSLAMRKVNLWGRGVMICFISAMTLGRVCSSLKAGILIMM